MKKLLLLILTTPILFSFSIDNKSNAEKVLNHWILAHNSGSKEKIQAFINEYYHPQILEKLSMEKHIHFYYTVYSDFGKVDPLIYEIITNEKDKLVVHLLKKGVSRAQVEIDPAHILEVEIDMHKQDGRFLDRGLGLGALICKRTR